MILFPNAKINIGLHVLNKRSDGYHNLETVFYPLPLQDALEIIGGKDGQNEDVVFTTSGIPLPLATENNICVSAYRLLKKDFAWLPPVTIHLHKVIPAGAGLGGGSADGAFTLLALAKKFSLSLTGGQLKSYALQLGSDCPLFIDNKPSFATGRGEILTPLPLQLNGHRLVVVNPRIHIATGWAFSQLDIRSPSPSLADAINQPIENWKDTIGNDFEQPIFRTYPVIKEIKEALYQYGALYASMSGSGSTVYGIFSKDEPPAFHFLPHYGVHLLTL